MEWWIYSIDISFVAFETQDRYINTLMFLRNNGEQTLLYFFVAMDLFFNLLSHVDTKASLGCISKYTNKHNLNSVVK